MHQARGVDTMEDKDKVAAQSRAAEEHEQERRREQERLNLLLREFRL
jgi:hypothetical protein